MSHYPQCEHIIKGVRCQEDSLGHCEICKIDGCFDHLDAFHRHAVRDDPIYVNETDEY